MRAGPASRCARAPRARDRAPRRRTTDTASAEANSEDLRAPGVQRPAEHRIRTRHRSAPELLDPAGLRELRERDAAEVRRTELGRVEADLSVFVGAIRGAVLELPATFVPGAERV